MLFFVSVFSIYSKRQMVSNQILIRFQSYRAYGLLGGEGFFEKKREPSFPVLFDTPADTEAAVGPPAV